MHPDGPIVFLGKSLGTPGANQGQDEMVPM